MNTRFSNNSRKESDYSKSADKNPIAKQSLQKQKNQEQKSALQAINRNVSKNTQSNRFSNSQMRQEAFNDDLQRFIKKHIPVKKAPDDLVNICRDIFLKG